MHVNHSQSITLAQPEVLKSWSDLCALYAAQHEEWDNQGWLFRGQSFPAGSTHGQQQLVTSLERALNRFGIPIEEAPSWEYRLLRDFKRRCHLATAQPPPFENDLEWLALLRHYGGPARLLDWTHSFWAGIHFAVENAYPGDICQMWALDAGWWRERTQYPRLAAILKKYGSNSIEESREVLKHRKHAGIWFLNPFRLNDRLSAQQGSFLLPLDITQPLAANLARLDPDHQRDGHLRLYQLEATPDLLTACLSHLQRMNLTRLTLYPGLAGLAQHYDNAIAMPHLFRDIGR
jgi:FRG domain-containing protein